MINRLKAPEIYSLTLGSLPEPVTYGKKLYLFPKNDINVFRMDLVFPKAGTGNSGLLKGNVMTGELIFGGTNNYDAQQIHNLFDVKGAYLNVETTYSKTVLSVYGLSKHMNYCSNLLIEILTDTIFPESELDILKSQKIQQLHTRIKKTGYQANIRLNERYFGENHPLGRITQDEDYLNIDSASVLNMYRKNFMNGFVILTGNTDKETVSLWNDYKMLNADDTVFAYEEVNGRPVNLIKEEGIVMLETNQSSISTRTLIVNRLHPDYFPLIMFNLILGGYFGSRIMKNIREEKGLTYGMYSSIQRIGNQTFLQISGDIKSDSTELVKIELEKEINKLKTEEIGEEEWLTALNYYIGNLQSSFDNFMSYPVKLINVLETDCEMSWFSEAVEQLKKVTPSDVMRVANTYFNKKSLVIAWAGPE